jgi:uncharacterized membrane protein AbrB (regulator of aidB expression)
MIENQSIDLILKIVVPIIVTVVGTLLTAILGFMGWWLKKLSDKTDENTKVLAEVSSKIGMLLMLTQPIHKLEKDIDAFHSWKREHEKGTNQ